MDNAVLKKTDNRVYFNLNGYECRTGNDGQGLWRWNAATKNWDQFLGIGQKSTTHTKIYKIWRNGQK